LQADGYAGFDKLYNETNPNHPIKEAACWAHCPEPRFIWSNVRPLMH
jgi:hypothetical protein